MKNKHRGAMKRWFLEMDRKSGEAFNGGQQV